jgi:outer membrane murein-binding lipoprotein Lpp
MFLQGDYKMKSKLIAVLLVMLLAVAGCSSGSKSNTPDDKIATINSMMSKGYEMSDNQRNNVNKAVEEAKKLISQNKIDEANMLLKKTINTLELIAETDRFNKSE